MSEIANISLRLSLSFTICIAYSMSSNGNSHCFSLHIILRNVFLLTEIDVSTVLSFPVVNDLK